MEETHGTFSESPIHMTKPHTDAFLYLIPVESSGRAGIG